LKKKLYKESESIAKKAIIMAKSIRYKKGVIDAEEQLAEIYYIIDEKKAIEYFKKLVPRRLKENNINKVSYYYNVIGLLSMHEGNYSEALLSFRKSLDFAKRIGDYHRMGNAANNIGLVLNIFEFYDKAIEYFKLSIEYEKEAVKNPNLFEGFINLAYSYNYKGEDEKALKSYNIAFDYALKFNQKYGMALFYNNMGSFYLAKNKLDTAYDYYKKALKISEKGEYKNLIPYIYNGLGEYYMNKGDLYKALYYQKKAEKLNREDDLKTMIYKNLLAVYLKMGDTKNAGKCFKIYLKYKDRKSSKNIYHELEKIFKLYEKERLEREIIIAKKEKKIQRLIIWIFILMIFIISIFSFVLYSKYRYGKKINLLLKKLSKKDPLTNLSNRRDVLEKASYLVKQSVRTGKPFSIIICDIDDFKNINDKYGHNAGDQILKELSLLLKRSLREIDIIGRWGGEEFIIILPETSDKQAEKALEKIKKTLEINNFIIKEVKIKVSMTFGIYEYPDRKESIVQAIEKADYAMYLGKKEGKNKIMIFEKQQTVL
jgi:diguanylate cyclase (GGDEF)-like protein